MRATRIIMGMPVILEVADSQAAPALLENSFSLLSLIDDRFSTYKEGSEISRINRGEIRAEEYSEDMKEIFALAEKTSKETSGFFDMRKPDGALDPSGVVKGWAIQKVADLLMEHGVTDFYVEIAGDIQCKGKNAKGEDWRIGIRNPFNQEEIVKVVSPRGKGLATSGTYVQGQHIYNPHEPQKEIADIISLTVIGPNICEADRFATAAFAMGKLGVAFIEELPGFDGYLIDKDGIATMTSGFQSYVTS